MAENAIDLDEVKKVAKLARLAISDEEARSLQKDLSAILGYVQKLDELKTDEVEPTSHAVDLPTKFRPDEIKESIDTELALKNAPERLGDGFGVPKIIE